jgi:acyl-CoA synthetase (AMP-forming)/AMP-acid ligase II
MSAPPLLDLRVHAARAQAHPAVVCGARRLSYGELEALANRMAAVWRAQGAQRGGHVAMLLGNVPEALAAAWAAWRCGVYLTPMSTALAAPELAAMVTDSGARIVLMDAELAGAPALAAALAAAVPGPLRWLSLRGPIPGFEPIEPLLAVASPLPAADEPPGALMMYTSGTTGAPKGVLRPLLPANWRGTPPFAADLLDLFGVGGSDVRYLSTAPLYHAAPLRVALAVTAGGGSVHVMDRFDAADALELLEREAITHSQWVPTMFQRLLALPAERRAAFHAPQHRRAIHGAAPCPVPLKRAMIDWWGPILLEYYSGSEGVGLTLIDSNEWLAHPGSVGRARKGRLHVVDEAGRELPPGVTGLVCFSGVAPFAYHKAPEKTAARTLPGGLQTFGDVGHADADGRLYLSDRLDDMIISGGVNIYPQEIEAVIADVPGVWECAVVGIDDERFGERPVAFVVARRGESAAALQAAVRAACEARLGRFKQPEGLHLVDELPRTPTGKLLRRQLRQRLTEENRA